MDESEVTFEVRSSLTDEPAIDRVFGAVTGWLKMTFIVGGLAMALAALSAPVLGRLRPAEIYAILGFYSQVWVLTWGLLAILRPLARKFAGALLVAFLVALPVSAMTFWVVERLHATAGEGLAGAECSALALSSPLS
ncbi:MAG: hypothetical protein ABR543_12250 [Gemmatimonadaceae bacterium]